MSCAVFPFLVQTRAFTGRVQWFYIGFCGRKQNRTASDEDITRSCVRCGGGRVSLEVVDERKKKEGEMTSS